MPEQDASVLLLQQLNQIQTGVTEIQRKQDIQNVKLFGAEDGENAQGRLPRVEASVTDHEERIETLEKSQVRNNVIIGMGASAVTFICDAIIRFLFGHR